MVHFDFLLIFFLICCSFNDHVNWDFVFHTSKKKQLFKIEKKLQMSSKLKLATKLHPLHFSCSLTCEFWGVLTSNGRITEGIRRFLYKPNWCIVVVEDGIVKPDFDFSSALGSNIIYLSRKDQFNIGSQIVELLPSEGIAR